MRHGFSGRPLSRPGQLSFFDFFLAHYAKVISCTMLKDHRESVGLGCPPTIYTTNASESPNAVIKGKVYYKETEWSQFNDELKQLADIQRDDAIRALSGGGPFQSREQHGRLKVDPNNWARMMPAQGKEAIKRFDNAQVRKCPLLSTHTSSTND